MNGIIKPGYYDDQRKGDKHGMRIIGTTDDSFNEKGTDFELKLLTKNMKMKEQIILEKQLMKLLQQMNLLQTSKKKDTKLSLAKYYLTFFFQAWDRNGVPVKFCAAVYALSAINSELLAKTQLEVITALTHYSFTVNTIASDGSSENRAANKNLDTLTTQDVFINNQVKLDELIKTGSPMNMKVDFNHPTLSNDGIVIFIDSDMLHLIKKFVNTLERSGLSTHDTDLHFHEHKLSLNMIHQLWCESGSNLSNSVRNVNKLTKDFFKLLKNESSPCTTNLF